MTTTKRHKSEEIVSAGSFSITPLVSSNIETPEQSPAPSMARRGRLCPPPIKLSIRRMVRTRKLRSEVYCRG
jgi:hypothetical protein